MGYMALDRVAMPPPSAAALSERLLLLPHCYQVNDHASYPLASSATSGASVGSAASTSGVVMRQLRFVNFNQIYKISDASSRAWCGVLIAAPRTALWLLHQPADAEPHLRSELAACGMHHPRCATFVL